MKAFKAYAKDGHVTASTAKEAGELFFKTFPNKRKCDIIEGEYDGHFFTVTFGKKSEGNWPQSFNDITKKQLEKLGS